MSNEKDYLQILLTRKLFMYSPPRGGNSKTDFMNTCKTSKTNQKKKIAQV